MCLGHNKDIMEESEEEQFVIACMLAEEEENVKISKKGK